MDYVLWGGVALGWLIAAGAIAIGLGKGIHYADQREREPLQIR